MTIKLLELPQVASLVHTISLSEYHVHYVIPRIDIYYYCCSIPRLHYVTAVPVGTGTRYYNYILGPPAISCPDSFRFLCAIKLQCLGTI